MATTSAPFRWSSNESACFFLLVLHENYKNLSPQQRTEVFNHQFGTGLSRKVVGDTYRNRFQTGRGQFWRRHENYDSPSQAERARRAGLRGAQRQKVEESMRALGIEDTNGPAATITTGRRFRLCSDELSAVVITDLKFEINTKEKLLQQLIDHGVLDEGSIDAQFHLEGEGCGSLRPLADLVITEGVESDVEPGKLKGRLILLH